MGMNALGAHSLELDRINFLLSLSLFFFLNFHF